MPNSDPRIDRDRSSARESARHAREKNNGYQNWTLEEVRDLYMLADNVETMSDDPERIEKLSIIKLRLLEIRDHDTVNVFNSIEDKVTEVWDDDAFVDPVETRDYLQEGLCRFEALQRELLRYRQRLDEIYATPS